ncbi:tetratricopeptide repeat protein [Oxalobacter formigenes]|uniref:Sel1 repeat protein n=1 Tax=Oxalobacter formigenes OXCC13 TaxID=556269 RepID=C3XA77_OXAFO|nr:tetratricopeptide repeat protein [Oxalobacter formigenes]ARQ45757.1 Localization factor PodJL [Oxalobacter formigenes]ARQ77990.1 hypothetical protein BRW84_04690 [Oxalobacter formigenes OXCC13]EEO30103.1 Sel1 repeat protein [Oxalobacter formigenes OXCC13]MCZ4063154.1 sel1 repeat family protein [Oxalobacter formigenes]QDX33460.1 sel1 repeat family protein [Oxalobacter formigenes]
MFSFLKKAVPVSLVLVSVGVLSACTTGQEMTAKLTAQAEKGDVEAMVELAEVYCGGKNIEQDDQICGMWMKRAAEKGHVRAQYMLGRMYELGLGMRADPVQAYKWYSLSAPHYHMSQTGAETVYAVMTPVQQSEARKVADEAKKTIPSKQ